MHPMLCKTSAPCYISRTIRVVMELEYLAQILVTLVVLFALARVGSAIVSRFGLPGLIGEILIGIAVANIPIGDTTLLEGVLGCVMPEPGVLTDHGNDVYHVIYALAEIGVIFLLFTVGLETRVNDLMKSGKPAFLCALLGVIVPFIFGVIVIMAYDGNMNHAMFLGAAMVATSVGITARIIKDMKLMDTREARIIIAAAVIDDVLGMIVLAIVKGMATSDSLSIGGIILIIAQAAIFVLAIIAICKWVIPRIYDYFEARRKAKMAEGKVPMSVNMLVVAIIVCLAMSALAEIIGLAAIIGAFLAGMMFADHAWEWDLEKKIDSITTFMLSFFFLNVGMQVDLNTLSNGSVLLLAAVVIVLAVIGKYIGCSLGSKMGDKTLDRHSLNIIGFGMVPRGEVGIIVASIGLSSGAMSSELYAVVVLMSVITTLIAPPIISKMFRSKYHDEYKILPEDRV